MPTVVGRKALCKCDDYETYFKSKQGVKGKSLFERIEAFENIVETRIKPQYQHFFAYPVFEGDDICWYSIPYNEIPTQYTALNDADKQKYSQIKNDTLQYYEAEIEKIKVQGNAIDAEMLEKALLFINDDFLYCYDDKVTLGVWGMQVRENVKQSLGYAVKNVFPSKPKTVPEPEVIPPPIPVEPVEQFNVRFDAGENGVINANNYFTKSKFDTLYADEIPAVVANKGYEFSGWDNDPANYRVEQDSIFRAQYNQIPPIVEKLPWYLRFWNWLKSLFLGRGCLRWFLWLLLLLLLLLLFSWLFRDCSCSGTGNGGGDSYDGGSAIIEGDSTWRRDNPNVGNEGGKYDANNPYTPVPTPPSHKDVLPPNQGVLPPVNGKPEEVPGNPTIMGHRLNILMENQDKSIMDLAKDFKQKYPDNKYKVVYYDDVVKRMQIEFPREERDNLKRDIPAKFAPDYDLFVFDEALFESRSIPNDPAFRNKETVWYFDAVNAYKAWEITKGSDKITVAIVDNGFNLQHEELRDKVVRPFNVWRHSDKVTAQTVDHGTHVAGIALASVNNNRGSSGIAPACRFMPIQVADDNGIMTTTSVLDGILYALYQGADVINVSLGTHFTGMSELPESVQKALISSRFKEEERLWRHVMRIAATHNSTIVLAAGNDNVLAGIDALQRPELFITVSATDKQNNAVAKAGFSNYGVYSTISAPGVSIYSSVGNNKYIAQDGTSMAAPIVTGAIALMKSINDKLTNKQIICALQSTGKPSNGKIGNLIQIDKALAKVKSGNFDNCNATPEVPSTGDVQVLLSWDNYNDLDIACEAPNGEVVFFQNKFSSCGGKLEIDMNVEYPDSKNPIENIYWPSGQAPKGKYNVYLIYYKQHESSKDETNYRITVKHGSKTDIYSGKIKASEKDKHICSFTL